MSDSEKWAWWVLGVVGLTVVAYGIMFIFLGHHPAIASVFALLALTVIPAASRRRLNTYPRTNENAQSPARRFGQVSA